MPGQQQAIGEFGAPPEMLATQSVPVAPVRRGPPNRMNDLPYRDWMKFQKSFFWHTSWETLAVECVHFFTKARWGNGEPSRTLLSGFGLAEAQAGWTPRDIDLVEPCSQSELTALLAKRLSRGDKYDFILLNLYDLVNTPEALDHFLDFESDALFSHLRMLLARERYCGLIVRSPNGSPATFPIPWAVSLAGRSKLRLRDEKIGLIRENGRVYYCLFFQSLDDSRPAVLRKSDSLHMVGNPEEIASWVIPKPPSRKRDEILHPAKFPEPLIQTFIERFTLPGQNVFDPMVGTGSAVVAAIQSGRNGYGIDLEPSFVEIASRRAGAAAQLKLWGGEPPKGRVVQGDATDLDSIEAFENIPFHYSVTSPPYWSMLTNPGSENQRARRQRNLRLIYSDSEQDLGNIQSYDEFLRVLVEVYRSVARRLIDGGHLTVIVKNVKRDHILYPLAWDLTFALCGDNGSFDYVGTTLWCQDDVGLKPFAVGTHWVSNTLHHYCLHFRRRPT